MTEAYKVIIRSALLAARAARLRQRGRSPEDLARRDLRWLSAGAGAGAWQKPSGRRRSRLRRSGRRAGKDLIVALLAATLAFGALGAAVVFWVVSEGDQGDQWTDYRTDDAEWGALGGACVLWLGVGVGSGCLLVVLLRKWRSRGEY
ncbi:MAG: hypothetical protein AMJ81_08635 [Phycisphaerae bacterium SM23_33]|nr:MAG: hypothetical protein AMJ81_08635 [Phycisphaerae bacterium SM23_33]